MAVPPDVPYNRRSKERERLRLLGWAHQKKRVRRGAQGAIEYILSAPIQDLKSNLIRRCCMPEIIGIEKVSLDDLVDLRNALNKEIGARERKAIEGLSHEINSKFTQIITRGFNVRIENETDEILLTDDDLGKIVVEVC